MLGNLGVFFLWYYNPKRVIQRYTMYPTGLPLIFIREGKGWKKTLRHFIVKLDVNCNK